MYDCPSVGNISRAALPMEEDCGQYKQRYCPPPLRQKRAGLDGPMRELRLSMLKERVNSFQVSNTTYLDRRAVRR